MVPHTQAHDAEREAAGNRETDKTALGLQAEGAWRDVPDISGRAFSRVRHAAGVGAENADHVHVRGGDADFLVAVLFPEPVPFVGHVALPAVAPPGGFRKVGEAVELLFLRFDPEGDLAFTHSDVCGAEAFDRCLIVICSGIPPLAQAGWLAVEQRGQG